MRDNHLAMSVPVVTRVTMASDPDRSRQQNFGIGALNANLISKQAIALRKWWWPTGLSRNPLITWLEAVSSWTIQDGGGEATAPLRLVWCRRDTHHRSTRLLQRGRRHDNC